MRVNSVQARNMIVKIIKDTTGIVASYKKNEGKKYPRATFFEVLRKSTTSSNDRYQKMVTFQISVFSKNTEDLNMDKLQKELVENTGVFCEDWRYLQIEEVNSDIHGYAIDFDVIIDG